MNKPRTFLHHIRRGQMFGYPNCCVFQYAVDIINNRKPFLLRGHIKAQYVPCDNCKLIVPMEGVSDESSRSSCSNK